MNKKSKSTAIRNTVIIAVMAVILIIAAAATTAESVQQTFWALVPPLIAIILALVTKEVYSSLLLGIIAGALLYSGFGFEGTVLHVFNDGILAVLTDSYNVGILIFLVMLGMMVALMNKAGGSAAFGQWASEHIKTRVGAQCATIILGILIFIDDYFNCLTVGSVMRPVTDKHQVSRAKLAYLIDATAAPVCIIAPISSWAAAVSGFVEGENGIALFVQTIPFNFYALLTIVMMFAIVFMKADYGLMAIHEKNAQKGDLYTTPDRPYANASEEKISSRGTVFDLVIPVISLVIFCVIGMIYSGGFFSGTNFIDAFAGSDASVGLALGSFFALVVTIILYLIRRVLSFKECMDSLPDGFKAMVPAILILIFAWSLKAMTDSLGAKEFVAGLVQHSAGSFMNFLPAIIFLIGVFLSFATGTSWGTFGILIPIVVHIFENGDYRMMIISMSACMAGAVCGDHCSPISDTTIMSSAGAQCNHLNHVSTQLPYAMTCAAVSFVTYIIAGFTKSAWISLPCGIVMIIAILAIMKKKTTKTEDEAANKQMEDLD
ncbi:MAG: Na+/H+ antiporter NhaC family protein [Eubacterium sp.]|nr:Na+/H+ antiporter NhaC family protein [Eubacterium sp.]